MRDVIIETSSWLSMSQKILLWVCWPLGEESVVRVEVDGSNRMTPRETQSSVNCVISSWILSYRHWKIIKVFQPENMVMIFNNKMLNIAIFCQYIIMDNGKWQKQPKTVAANSQENIQHIERAVGIKSRIQGKDCQSDWILHQNPPTEPQERVLAWSSM